MECVCTELFLPPKCLILLINGGICFFYSENPRINMNFRDGLELESWLCYNL